MAKHFEHVADVRERWQRRYARRGLGPVERRRLDWRWLQRVLCKRLRAERYECGREAQTHL